MSDTRPNEGHCPTLILLDNSALALGPFVARDSETGAELSLTELAMCIGSSDDPRCAATVYASFTVNQMLRLENYPFIQLDEEELRQIGAPQPAPGPPPPFRLTTVGEHIPRILGTTFLGAFRQGR